MTISSIAPQGAAEAVLAATAAGDLTPRAPASAAPTAADIKKAVGQFEAIILRQLLEPSIAPVMSGGLGGASGTGGGIYGYMLTDVLATNLAQGGGLGLSKMLEKQLTPKAVVTDITSSAALKHQPSLHPSS